MLYLLLLIPAILILEAYIESKIGDKRHWASLIGTYLASMLLWLLFARASLHIDVNGDQINAVNRETFIAWNYYYLCCRAWFDYVYNYFAGEDPNYLGIVSWTDRMLDRFLPNPAHRFMLRCAVSAGFLFSFATWMSEYYATIGWQDQWGYWILAVFSLAWLFTGYKVLKKHEIIK